MTPSYDLEQAIRDISAAVCVLGLVLDAIVKIIYNTIHIYLMKYFCLLKVSIVCVFAYCPSNDI